MVFIKDRRDRPQFNNSLSQTIAGGHDFLLGAYIIPVIRNVVILSDSSLNNLNPNLSKMLWDRRSGRPPGL